MSRILVVDDDPSILAAFRQMLSDQGHAVDTAPRAEVALERIDAQCPDLVIMDIRMPGMSGLECVQQIRKNHPRLPVIIMTGYTTAEVAIEATKLGAFDYHLKPLVPEEIMQSIERALERSRMMNQPVELEIETDSPAGDAIIGRSRGMQEVYKAIGHVAQTDAAVLIRGETGTGKELVARAIYQHSLRARAALVVVNCAAIPETLLESEFFGFEKGAFTGADKPRIGKFEQANGGTVFLDEVGDMPLGLQAKVLRVLDAKTFARVGGNEEIPSDVRILAATHRDLAAEMAAKRFREDLFHRLGVFTIDIPPLRERREDIPRLAAYFLRKFAGELATEMPVLSQDAMGVLKEYSWPGNVRELQHCIHRVMILSSGYPIHPDDVRRAIALLSATAAPEATIGNLDVIIQEYLRRHGGDSAYENFFAAVEKALLAEALRLARGNQTHAAKLLGIARPTLKAKLDKYGLAPDPR